MEEYIMLAYVPCLFFLKQDQIKQTMEMGFAISLCLLDIK